MTLGSDFLIEGSFRTAVGDGVILFNGGNQDRDPFFLLELHRGRLYLVLNFGNSIQRFAFPEVTIDDAMEHVFVIDRDRRYACTLLKCTSTFMSTYCTFRRLGLLLDDERVDFNSLPRDGILTPSSNLFIGGVDSTSRLPWHSWSGGSMFVGCLLNLEISATPVDLGELLQCVKDKLGYILYFSCMFFFFYI